MKTTLNISDSILIGAKELASIEKTTLTEIVEISLKEYISQKNSQKKAIQWKKSHFGKNGLVEDLEGGSWSDIRDISYGLKS